MGSMKRILYAGGRFLTDDAIADALMEYANVLAIVNSADVVSFPGIDDAGDIREFRLIVGPASQILSVSSEDVPVELNGRQAVADLRDRARRRLPDSLGVGDAGGYPPAETDAESTTHDTR